jgi:hypothetical protein
MHITVKFQEKANAAMKEASAHYAEVSYCD